MRLLVVEDQMELREILRRQLDEKGYAADACPDAFQAQDYLEAAEYDIVILDIGLPGMDGVALVEWIRRKNLDVQVLLLTAMDSIEDKVRGLDSGADDYMTKPFAFEELLARLRTPVSVIMSQSEYALRHGDDPEEMAESLRKIHEQSRKMSELISRLLFLSRADGGRQQIHKKRWTSGLVQRKAQPCSWSLPAKRVSV